MQFGKAMSELYCTQNANWKCFVRTILHSKCKQETLCQNFIPLKMHIGSACQRREEISNKLLSFVIDIPELRNCVKVEVAPHPKYSSPCGLCGGKATLHKLRNCVKVEVAILGFLSQIVLMVFVGLKQH